MSEDLITTILELENGVKLTLPYDLPIKVDFISIEIRGSTIDQARQAYTKIESQLITVGRILPGSKILGSNQV